MGERNTWNHPPSTTRSWPAAKIAPFIGRERAEKTVDEFGQTPKAPILNSDGTLHEDDKTL